MKWVMRKIACHLLHGSRKRPIQNAEINGTLRLDLRALGGLQQSIELTLENLRPSLPQATLGNTSDHAEPLNDQEVFNILKIDLQEVEVFCQNSIIRSAPGIAKEILAPSKAGPVSQNYFVMQESEGQK